MPFAAFVAIDPGGRFLDCVSYGEAVDVPEFPELPLDNITVPACVMHPHAMRADEVGVVVLNLEVVRGEG